MRGTSVCLVCWDLTFKQILITKPQKIKLYSVIALKRYLNERNLIHGRVMATISKFSPQIFETYFINKPKATITLCDVSAVILFKLAHSCLNAFNLIQWYIMGSKETATQITLSEGWFTRSDFGIRFFNWHCFSS